MVIFLTSQGICVVCSLGFQVSCFRFTSRTFTKQNMAATLKFTTLRGGKVPRLIFDKGIRKRVIYTGMLWILVWSTEWVQTPFVRNDAMCGDLISTIKFNPPECFDEVNNNVQEYEHVLNQPLFLTGLCQKSLRRSSASMPRLTKLAFISTNCLLWPRPIAMHTTHLVGE